MAVALDLAAFVLVGMGLAGAYAAALAYNARLYLSTGGLGGAALVHLGRTLLVLVAFVLLARAGARPLGLALCGFASTHMAILSAARGRA
jgi:hypothetical protein